MKNTPDRAPLAGDMEAIEARLIAAVRTFDRLPDRDRSFLASKMEPLFKHASNEYAGHWDPDLHKRELAPITLPVTIQEMTAAEEALDWMALVPPHDRRLMGRVLALKARGRHGRAFTLAARLMREDGERGHTADGLRMRYRRALRRLACALNAC